MLESITFRCQPGAQFHFGKIALDENASLDDTSSLMHSDSLASAFVDTAFKVLDERVALQVLSDFETGTVRVSSLLWRLNLPSGKSVYFLPKPVSLVAIGNDSESKNQRDRKETLKIQFISKGVWEAGILPEQWPEYCVIVQKEFVMTLEEAEGLSDEMAKKLRLYHMVSLPKVAVHKLTRENSLYHQTNVQVANLDAFGLKDATVHFYFLLESNSHPARDRVCNLAQIMVDEGIGGERSVGCGRLASCENAQVFHLNPVARKEDLFCTASLASPKDQAEFGHFLSWKIITRGGRATANDGPLKRLKMIAEGAMLKAKVGGSTHDISTQKSRRYLRFGTALCLPVHDQYQPVSEP